MKNILLLFIILNFSCKQKNEISYNQLTNNTQNKDIEYQKNSQQNLYNLIGTNFNSKRAKNFLNNMGQYRI